uniref:CARDB protein n=1 Tax=Candidatus Kentrum sp. FM TaxID=2126340 RepID=A0A450T6T1_9GAMM|nr:MAG: CARDB protein [Candidatus Kentron sp. FM]VFJ62376.1 MAG: CARDB protein [Candidatus Kentron sp. FM]VFK13915.1 MAG: CARDB protein [Candidatus Kentron sp. FM]
MSTKRPDLKVTRLSTDKTTYTAGETIRITSTTKNSGNRSTGYSYTKFYLSRDTTLDSSDIYLDYDYVSRRSAGSSATDTISERLSSSLSGRYYLIAKADATGRVSESNEGNNTRVLSGALNIIGAKPNRSDLIISSGSATGSFTSGGKVKAKVTLKNQGSSTGTKFYTRYYLSTDSTITTGDTYLDNDNTRGLSAGKTTKESESFRLPTDLVAGQTYYLGAIVDYNGKVSESKENNNTLVLKSFEVQSPDLMIASGSATGSFTSGGKVKAKVTLKNQGSSTGTKFYTRYYLSTDSTITTGDTYLDNDNTRGLSAGKTTKESEWFRLPTNLVAGQTYYLGAIVDYDGKVSESKENNNTLVLKSFEVQSPGLQSPDLMIASGSATGSFTSGGKVKAKVTLKNQGSSTGTKFYTRYYLSTDSTITTDDTYLDYDSTRGLSAGKTTKESEWFRLPTNLVSGKTYYLGAIVDYSGRISESNESNNGRVLKKFNATSEITNRENQLLSLASDFVDNFDQGIQAVARSTDIHSIRPIAPQLRYIAGMDTPSGLKTLDPSRVDGVLSSARMLAELAVGIEVLTAINAAMDEYTMTGDVGSAANEGLQELLTSFGSGVGGYVGAVKVVGQLIPVGRMAGIVLRIGSSVAISVGLDEMADSVWDRYLDEPMTNAANWAVDNGRFALNATTQGYRDAYAYLFDGTFSGTSSVDTFNGGPGDDILAGGEGNDTLTGGWGKDTFRFVTADEGVDIITDFDAGTDKIEVVSSNFGNLTVGTLASNHFQYGTTASNAGPVFLYNKGTGTLSFDKDGRNSAAPVQIASLTGNRDLRYSDIQVVAA